MKSNEKQQRPDAAAHGGKRVLIIDDSELTLTLLTVVFEGEGFAVRLSSNLHEFEQQLADFWPDVIIADVDMPEMSGAELCAHIKQRIRVPVVLFSSLPDHELAVLTENVGADAYFSKSNGYEGVVGLIRDLWGDGDEEGGILH